MMFRPFDKFLAALIGIGVGLAAGCGNLGTKAALSPATPSETENEAVLSPAASPQTEDGNAWGGSSGGIDTRERIASADPTPPMVPLSDMEQLLPLKFGYRLLASYGPRFLRTLNPRHPERLQFTVGGPVEVLLLPQWIHMAVDGPYGYWYSTLDGTTLRYIWTPPGEGSSEEARACDLVLHDTGGPIGTEIFPLVPEGAQVHLSLAPGRLNVYAYDPGWEVAPEDMVTPVPGVPTCEEGLGPLSAEDLEKFTSRKFINTGDKSVFHLASFDLVPTADVTLPPKSLSTMPRR